MIDEKGRERNPELKSLTELLGCTVKEGILDTVEKEKAQGKRIAALLKKDFAMFDRCHQGSWDAACRRWT